MKILSRNTEKTVNSRRLLASLPSRFFSLVCRINIYVYKYVNEKLGICIHIFLKAVFCYRKDQDKSLHWL